MVTGSDVAELKARLSSSGERLLRSIEGVTEEQFKRRTETPEGGEPRPWSIAEALAHLLAAERLWAERIEAALATDGTPVAASQPDWNQEQARTGRFAPVPQLVHGLLASQRHLDRLIDRAAAVPGGFDRSVEHSTRGRLTVRDMVDRFGIAVMDEHTERIEGLRSIVGARPRP